MIDAHESQHSRRSIPGSPQEDPNWKIPTDVAEHWNVPTGTIDVWWRGMKNGALMMLLAHLLHQNPGGETIRFACCASSTTKRRPTRCESTSSKWEQRRESRSSPRSSCRTIGRPTSSAQGLEHAAIVLLGFQTPEVGKELELYERMEELAGDLPRVLFVDSAGGMALSPKCKSHERPGL